MNLQIVFEDGQQKQFKLNNGVLEYADASQAVDLFELSSKKFHVLVNGRSLEVEFEGFIDGEKGRIQLKVGNKRQIVTVKTDTDLLLEKLGLNTKKQVGFKELKAPMPGLVVNVLVEEGKIITAGEPVLVLEAMKMENLLKAPSDVTIGKILVAKGQKVEKNQVLISFL